jgi:hypothetical protein
MKAQRAAMKRARALEVPERTVKCGALRVVVVMACPFRGLGRRSCSRALFIAALCAFIVTTFLVDVQRGVSTPNAPAQVELRT